jgi:hypothetical protein
VAVTEARRRAEQFDARRSSAVARSLGATPGQVSAGLSGAQVLPALAGALLGIPGGIGLVGLVAGRRRDRDRGRGGRVHHDPGPHRGPPIGGQRFAG